MVDEITRRIGARMAHLSRERATHNATTNTQMTERFSYPTASLVIAHRLSTVRAADLILVVEDGRIVAEVYETRFAESEAVA
ncbi:MAG: hypothetical protein SV966_12130 [Actinomycetota bacterium]|nr:hypothetical protein [Actinomycetota bacterium]